MVSPLSSIVAGVRSPNPLANIGQQMQSSNLANQQQQLNQQRMQQNTQNMQLQKRQLSQEDAQRQLLFVNRLGKQLLNQDESRWPQMLQAHLPALASIGYSPETLQGMTRQQLEAVVAQTDAAIGGSPQGEQFTLSEGQVRFDSSGRPIAGVERSTDEKTQPKIDKLRGRYDSLTKDLRQVDAAYNKVKTAPTTAAGDMSMIFNYMKMLDPGSTVREGEFANAEQAAGVPTRILNIYNRLISGERLSEEQRADFSETSKSAYDAQLASADKFTATLLQQADQDGVSRESVLGAKNLREFEKRAADKLINRSSNSEIIALEAEIIALEVELFGE